MLLLAALLPACVPSGPMGGHADAGAERAEAVLITGMAGTPADPPWELEIEPEPEPEPDAGMPTDDSPAPAEPDPVVEPPPPPPCDDSDSDGVCDDADDDACPLGDSDSDSDGWADACDQVLWEQSISVESAALSAGASGRWRLLRSDGSVYQVSAPITPGWTSPPDDTNTADMIGALRSRYQGIPGQARPQVVSDGVGYSAAATWVEIPAMGDSVLLRLVLTGHTRNGSASATWQLRGYDPTPPM